MLNLKSCLFVGIVRLGFTRNELVRDVDRSWGKYLPVMTDFPAEKSHYKQCIT